MTIVGRYVADEDLIDAVERDRSMRVRVRREGGVSVVLGRGSKATEELDVAACLADGVPILRRRGGGCAVLLDPGNLIVSVVRPLPGLTGISTHFEWLSAWLADVLAGLGIRGVAHEGTSDLAVGGRKIGGSCIFRRKDLLYYSTTLLVEPRIDLIERYIAHPPREPEYRRGRPHREFLRGLSDAPFRWTTERLLTALRETATREALRSFAVPQR
ncbi:MAG: hypothetical protein OEQ13_10095 [Acidobacteriota bacterium]|nr:hypothetical protein [Acidobacteriota bacterium]